MVVARRRLFLKLRRSIARIITQAYSQERSPPAIGAQSVSFFSLQTRLPAMLTFKLILIRLFVICMTLGAAGAHAQVTGESEQRVLRGYVPYQQGQLSRAAQLFRADAKLGIRAAQYNLAVMILRGEAKVSPAKQTHSEAIAWLRRSAESAFPDAQFAVGKLYEDGELLPRNLATALLWYERAAKQQHLDAQLEMIASHMLGRGTPANPERAAYWAQQAADKGDAGAQYLLASFYENGDGVARDLQKAFDWYAQAARNGDSSASFKAKDIAERMKAS
jgi:uncharacterized protein